MIKNEDAAQLALSFEGAEEKPHFERISFRIKKGIFATLDQTKNQMNVRLNEVDQSVFTELSKGSIYPVDGGWGKQGWTTVELSGVSEDMLQDVLETAYNYRRN
jgi:predicted DNA-binding protein (MmcQ/YjbR family)